MSLHKASLRLPLLAVVLIVALLIGGCGGTTTTTPDTGEAAPTAETTASPAEETTTPEEGDDDSTGDTSESETDSERGTGDTLQLISWEAPTILNPHLNVGIKDFVAARITYEPLASFDKDGELVPFLAADIPSFENGDVAEDGLSVTWRLKEGVQWCDGEDFTAEDVVFTYEYLSNPDVDSYDGTYYESVERVEIVDDYTVTVYFSQPNPAWATPFVGWGGLILPQHIFADYNGSNAREAPANNEPVGTGPYCVISFEPGEKLLLGDELVETNKIVYEPNPYYREPNKPYFRRVELLGGGASELAAKRLFEEGTADYAFNLQLTPEDWEAYDNSEHAVAHTNFTFYIQQLDINHTDPLSETADGERSSLENPHRFFDDKTVREAFTYAIDREAIAALYGEAGRPISNILVEPEVFRSPNTSFTYDLDRAAALLDEAGWVDTDGDGIRDKDGVPMRVLFQTFVSPRTQDIQVIIKESLQSIGVEVETKLIDSSVYYGGDQSSADTFERFQADLQLWENLSDNPNPGPFMSQWTCSQIPQQENNWLAGYNTARWCNPDYDALYEQSTTELDREERRKLFIEMNDMLVEDAAVVPLVHIAVVSGSSRSLAGVDLSPWDADTWNIEDWTRTEPSSQ